MTSSIAIAALAWAAMAWQAQDPAPVGSQALDVQCLLAAASRGVPADTAERAAMQMGSMFFHGRLSARVPDDRLEEVLWEQSQLMRGVDQQALMRTCGQILVQAGARISQAGRSMAAREQAQAPH